MIFWGRPDRQRMAEYVSSVGASDLSYAEVGRTNPDRGLADLRKRYDVDHYRTELGRGPKVFDLAKSGLRSWEGFRIGWIEAIPCNPIQPGTAVGVAVTLFTAYWLNVCRIVYVIDDPEPPQRFGFAYGTLQYHAEQGEELFLVSRDPTTDTVTYEIRAFSRPKHPLARIARPLVRRLQRRFARESLSALNEFVRLNLPPSGSSTELPPIVSRGEPSDISTK